MALTRVRKFLQHNKRRTFFTTNSPSMGIWMVSRLSTISECIRGPHMAKICSTCLLQICYRECRRRIQRIRRVWGWFACGRISLDTAIQPQFLITWLMLIGIQFVVLVSIWPLGRSWYPVHPPQQLDLICGEIWSLDSLISEEFWVFFWKKIKNVSYPKGPAFELSVVFFFPVIQVLKCHWLNHNSYKIFSTSYYTFELKY